MNAPTTITEPTEPTDLIAFAADNPVAVLTDSARFDAFYDRIKALVDAHVPDLTTDKGRKAIASLARKVVTSKTALDDAGKKLTEDKRKEIAAVDAARRNIREKLDALRDEARRPLTEWETAEQDRLNKVSDALTEIGSAGQARLEDTSETVEARLSTLEAMELDAHVFRDQLPTVSAELARAIDNLQLAHARLLKEEADRAELEALRKEAAERAEREAREAAEREAAEAKAREEEERAIREVQAKAEAAAREERERVAREEAARVAAEQAAAQAKAAAEQKAREEQEARDRAHQEALAAERRAREEAEAKAKADQDRRDREDREAKEKADAEADAKARREADIAHKSEILRAAKEAVMEAAGLTEPKAKAVIQAIASGLVPNVTVSF